MTSFLVFLVALHFSAQNVFAQDPGTGPGAQAQALYAAGKYEEALRLWEISPPDTAAGHYNLGTTYFRLGKYGLALAHLEKADALRPHDPAIRTNLELARAQAARLIGSDKLDPASTWLESLTAEVDEAAALTGVGALALLTVLCWLLVYRRARSVRGAVTHPASESLLALLGVSVLFLAAQRFCATRPAAMVTAAQLVRSGPGERFAELGRIEPGMKIRALGPESQGWRQVRFGAEAIGWVPAASVLLL
jgi:tetratricopeptide (TPR) repeat protein